MRNLSKLFALTPFFVVVATVCVSCKRGAETFTPLDTETKDFYNWQVGSYWLMQDSATGTIDSIWVKDYSVGKMQNGYNETEEEVVVDLRDSSLANLKSTAQLYFRLHDTYNVSFSVLNDGANYGFPTGAFIHPTDTSLKSYYYNGRTYHSSIVRSLYSGTPNVGSYYTCNLVISKDSGLVYISGDMPQFHYSMHLVRSFIAR